MARRARLLLLAATALAGGCALGPDFERPAVEQPAAFREAVGGESIANLPWWQLFGDPVLQDLERAALERNQDVRIAAARVEEAVAALGFTRAEQFPAFGIGAGATRARASDARGAIPGGIGEDYLVYANVAWEIDIWGRLRRGTESARAQLLATEAAREGVTLTVAAAVADLYFQLRDLDARLEITRRTLAGRRESLELIRTRFAGGIVSELEVRQAEVEEATAAAAVPALERGIAAVEGALSVLTGVAPRTIPRGAPLDAAAVPATAPPGLPAQLLDRRPDVREAEALAHAQMARVGIAEALRLPTLSLTGAAGLQADDAGNLSDGDFWSIGGNLVGPLFEFGRNQRRVEVERARTEQAVLGYERTVLAAYRDVDDALSALRTGADEYEARRRQVESARAAARLSRARWDGGVTSYLEVLDSERSLFSAELQASAALQQRYAALVQLYKALGGGWEAP